MANTVIDGKTCLEKRGFVERHRLIAENIYNGKDDAYEYSSMHENAISEPNSKKGKGRNGAGHLHWTPYTGTPKTSKNEIHYSNFITVSTDGATVGGMCDIQERDRLSSISLFSKDENEYSADNENAISNGQIHGKGTGIPLDTSNGGGGYDVIARGEQILLNFYNGKDDAYEYSSRHENAKSTPNSVYPYNMKGKGSGSGGHTDYQGYYGKPNIDFNYINYKNFITISDETNTIGNKIDVDSRKNLSLKRRYNRGINEYSSQNIDAISNGDIIGKGTNLYLDTFNGGGGYDIVSRERHLFRNEWKRDLQYTKALVESEYAIQTEFKVSSYEDLLLETSKQDYANGLRQQKNKLEQRLEAIETSTKPKENLSKR